MKAKIYILCLLMSVIAACTKSDSTATGNPLVSLKINGSSRNATVASFKFWRELYNAIVPTAVAMPTSIADSTGRTVVLSSFWTTVGQIEFKTTQAPTAGEVDGTDVEFPGPYTVNILETNVPALGTATLNINQIERVKVKLIRTLSLPASAPAQLMNNSIYISGTVGGVAITYSTTNESVMEIGGPNPLALGSAANLLLQIQVANLFKKIDLSGISSPTDISDSNRVNAVNPCPAIDASAADLFTCFRKGLESEGNLGSDINGDNELGTGDATVK